MNHTKAITLVALWLILVPALLFADVVAGAPSDRGPGRPRQVKTVRPLRGRIAASVSDSSLLRLSRDMIDFGSIVFGTEALDSLALISVGGDSVRITGAWLIGADAASFERVGEIVGLLLPPSRFVWGMIRFRPLDTGCAVAGLVITWDGGADTLDLLGCSRYSTMPIGGDTLRFPLTRVDSCAVLGDTLVNTFSDTLRVLLGVGDGGDFSTTDIAPGAIIAIPPGGILPLSFRFCPDTIGLLASSYQIRTSAGIWTVVMGGTGGAPQLAIDPSEIGFGQVPVDGYRDSSIEVSNIGAFPLLVSRESFGNSFSLAPGERSSFVLLPAETGRLRIRFAPVGRGPYYSIDTIFSNSFGGRLTLINRGEGVPGHLFYLDSAVGVVGDTLRLHLRASPPIAPDERLVRWHLRLLVDPHALYIVRAYGADGSADLTRIGDSVVELGYQGVFPGGSTVGSVDILGLSTAAPVNPVRIVTSTFDSVGVVATGDGSAILSGCVIGNAVPLARRAAIISAGWSAAGGLAVRYRLPDRVDGVLRVVDVVGREAMRRSLPGPGDQDRELSLPTIGMPAGLYFLELSVADDRSIVPIMIAQ